MQFFWSLVVSMLGLVLVMVCCWRLVLDVFVGVIGVEDERQTSLRLLVSLILLAVLLTASIMLMIVTLFRSSTVLLVLTPLILTWLISEIPHL